MEEKSDKAKRATLDDRQKMTELERLRHSVAHVLANAMLKLWPDAQLASGPAVENGFYYDVELNHRITPEDFQKIEAEMKAIVKANQTFERKIVPRNQALDDAKLGRLGALSERPVSSKFKIGNLEDISEDEPISYYQNGDFIDLCAGPHVMRTGNIKAFKLTQVASAYYKGDEKNPQLQHIYGTAFKTQAEMDAYFKMLEDAKKRDHRKIGLEMGLYAIDTEFTGPGLPLWLPKGTAIVEELEKLAKETEFAAGYVRVKTPHLAREKMYKTSGHLPYYAESMFPPMELCEESGSKNLTEKAEKAGAVERYYLKAMNCPHHHRIFSTQPRSYRDLPLRLAEYGTCYRYEQSGELFGLMRVRSLNMNDAHIYCRPEQFAAEFNAVNEMYLKYFTIFGIEKYIMRFSTHDPAKLGQKFVDEPELWRQTEDMVRQVLIDSKINYIEVANEAAFYGPKIDVQVWSVIGREFTLATNQVDFAVPKRFGLVYRDRDNADKTPLCIHRAPLGTHERFIGFLIEHYSGNFPLWLAPDQVRVMTIGDDEKLVRYASQIVNELRAAQVRVEGDFGNDKINGKILRAEESKTHTMMVIGPRDMNTNNVSIRIHGKGNQGAKPRVEAIAGILKQIKERH